MLSKLTGIVLIASCFCLMACHTNEEKKEDTASVPAIQKPADPLLVLEKKLALDSQNIELRLTLAANYYAAGDLPKAMTQFSRVYHQDRKNLVAVTNLGNICYDNHEDDNAINYYEQALDIDSLNLNIRCDLATCYSNINKLKKAIQILRGNIKIDPKHEKSHYNLAVILTKKGDKKEAEEEMAIYHSLTGTIKK